VISSTNNKDTDKETGEEEKDKRRNNKQHVEET
jgi:hypothetical protein